MSDNVLSIHHCGVIVQSTERALTFYCGVLGLKLNTQRPDLGYPGAWLDVGIQQIHLLELPNPDPTDSRPEHGGRDRHVALLVKSLPEVEDKLKENDCPYTLSKSGRKALFCRDPDGNAVEVVELCC
ncbi:MAG: glyoxalase [Gammaproteobacteria bacterium]|nr:glyoxalase [Gammaproteobacteria bacterium]